MPAGVDLEVRPLSARSVVVSLLLGAHPEGMTARQLVATGEHFGVSAATVRVALTRAVASGDLRRTATTYDLGERLLARRERQEQRASPLPWDGTWQLAVVVSAGRPSDERAALRTHLASLRMAELREGVWLRPANLAGALPPGEHPTLQTFTATPEQDPAELVAALWDLPAWALEAEAALALLQATSRPAERFAVAAHLVRHLTTDPLLPSGLWPPDWPAARARQASDTFALEARAVSRNGDLGV